MLKYCDLQIVENRCYFKLTGCSNDEYKSIIEFKSWKLKSWKYGLECKYFVYVYSNKENEKVGWCYVGFAPILIRHLQSLGYMINGKELFRARPIQIGNMLYRLYDFQSQAIEEWINSGCCGVIKSPTGSGKTITSCEIIRQMGVRTIIIVHTSDLLVNAWLNTLSEQFGENIKSKIGIIGGGLGKGDRKSMRIDANASFQNNVSKDIVIATAQSLLSKSKINKISNEKFGLLVWDECLPYDTLIRTSQGLYEIGKLFEIYNNKDTRYLVKRMKVNSLNLYNMRIFKTEFIPKKTVTKKMYEIKIESGISFTLSHDHKCLTKDGNNFEYKEVSKCSNVAYSLTEFLKKQKRHITELEWEWIIKVKGDIIFLDIISRKFIKEEQGYDLEVLNDSHNYFIGNGVNVHNCHHVSADQFNKVASAIRAPYRCGLSATLSRSDGTSPLIYGLMGDLCYKITIKELIAKGVLVEPVFNTMIINDEKIQSEIATCGLVKLDLSRYIKQLSASSVIKMNYIMRLAKSLCMNGKKFIMYTDFVNANNNKIFTRDFYVHHLNTNGVRVIGVSSDMSGGEREKVFNLLEDGRLDGLVFGKLGGEGVNIPKVDSVIMANATKSTILFPQRVGRSMRTVKTDKNKKNAFIYEILLNIPMELKWQEHNFFEYSSEGYVKEKIYIK